MMRSAIEALFVAMLQGEWFTESNGDTDCPLGYFGRVSNSLPELKEIREAFSETIEAYGNPRDEEIVGHFFCVLDGQGIIHIYRKETVKEVIDQYNWNTMEYAEWLDRNEVEV